MGHLTLPTDAARTDPYADADRAKFLASAKAVIGEEFAALTPAQQREFEDIVLLGLHCAENLTGPILGSADVGTFLYDPMTGLPR